MDEFFLRFSLQQSAGVLAENEFDCYTKVGADIDKINSFTKHCCELQNKQAEKLMNKYSDSIGKINGMSIMFIGDSMTADRLSYRGIVTKAAMLKGRSIAFSGATSCDMHRFLFESCMSADIASIMIGTNDAYFVGGMEKNEIVGKQEYRRNIRAILNECTKRCKKTVIMTPPPMHEGRWHKNGLDGHKTNNNQNIDLYCDIVREEAKRYGAVLCDINKEIKTRDENEMFIEDGIHLSYMGQCILSDMWLGNILK